VPGQVYYNATRRLVLQGATRVVLVGDSQARQLDENLESLQNLQSNLLEHGVDIRTMPLVLQYNKQDLRASWCSAPPELDDALNFRGVPSFAADALHGSGVFEPEGILRAGLEAARRRKHDDHARHPSSPSTRSSSGAANRLAVTAGRTCRRTRSAYNPLFIYSGRGSARRTC